MSDYDDPLNEVHRIDRSLFTISRLIEWCALFTLENESMGIYAVFYHSKRDAQHVANVISNLDITDLLIITPSKNDESRRKMEKAIWDAVESNRFDTEIIPYTVLEYDSKVSRDLLNKLCNHIIQKSGNRQASFVNEYIIDVSKATPQESVVAGMLSLIVGATVIKTEKDDVTTIQEPMDPIILTVNQYKLIKSMGDGRTFTNKDVESSGFSESTGTDMTRNLEELKCVDVVRDTQHRPGRPINVYRVNDNGRIAGLINEHYLPLQYRKGYKSDKGE